MARRAYATGLGAANGEEGRGSRTAPVLWAVGAVVGVWVTTRTARQVGFPGGRSLAVACGVALAIVVGAKLLYLAEHAWLPDDPAMPRSQESISQLLRYGFRIPGGILLFALVLPFICLRLHVPTLRFADLNFQGIGVALVFIRIGCFLNGCCFGAVTRFPLAITFPPGAEVYDWQLAHGLISASAPHTLPVHPLQLYFALLGLGVYLLARHIQRKQRFDGQVWMSCYVLFFGGTFFLELLRPQPLHLNLGLCMAVVLVTLGIRLRARQPTRLAAAPVSLHSELVKTRFPQGERISS